MKAMIFAAGLGTRLKPLTDHMPKALVPVAGRPMLEHVILKLKEAGFTELVINIHHFGEQISAMNVTDCSIQEAVSKRRQPSLQERNRFWYTMWTSCRMPT